ncbi:hypothetical protein SSCG_02958, partial [Streptomyces clavuligerus]
MEGPYARTGQPERDGNGTGPAMGPDRDGRTGARSEGARMTLADGSRPGGADRSDGPEPYDVITMGRIGVDLYPLRTGVPLARVDVFGKFLGGSATNVAVGAARLGRRTAVITRTGQDAFGEYAHEALRGFGVDDRWVTPVPAYPTPVTFCEIFPPDDFPLWFYRQPKAPDLEILPQELDLALFFGPALLLFFPVLCSLLFLAYFLSFFPHSYPVASLPLLLFSLFTRLGHFISPVHTAPHITYHCHLLLCLYFLLPPSPSLDI